METRKHSRNKWTVFGVAMIGSELKRCVLLLNRHVPPNHQINRVHKTWEISKEGKRWHVLARKPIKTKGQMCFSDIKTSSETVVVSFPFSHKAEILENITSMQTYAQFSHRVFFVSSSSSRNISKHTHKKMLWAVRIKAVIQKTSHCQLCWRSSRDREKTPWELLRTEC